MISGHVPPEEYHFSCFNSHAMFLLRSRITMSVAVFSQTLYKTQVRELKEECEERNKLYKDGQQTQQDLQEER